MEVAQTLREGGATALLIIVAWLCGVVWSVVALVLQWRRGAERSPPEQALAGPLGLLALVALFGVVGVAEARGAFAEMVLAPGSVDPAQTATRFAQQMSLQVHVLPLWSLALSTLAPLVACAALLPATVRATREQQPVLAPLAAGFGLVAPLMAGLQAGVLPYALSLTRSFSAVAAVDASSKAQLIEAAVREAGGNLLAARIVVAVTAVAGAIAVAMAGAWWARAGRFAGMRLVGGAAALFALGVTAFALTRAHAADTAAMPTVEAGSGVVPAWLLERAPLAQRCVPLAQPAPLLSLGDEDRLDWRKLASSAELADPLVTARSNFRRLHPDAPLPRALLIVADARLPMARAADYLRAARGAGVAEVGLVLGSPRPLHTRTLGTLPRTLACVVELRLGDGGAPASAFATWGDLVSAAEHAPMTLTP